MKNLIRTNSAAGGGGGGGDLDRNPNLHHMHQYGDFDHRPLHDHQSTQCPPGMEHQQHLFACGSGPHMLPLVARSFSCSQPSGMGDYPSENIKHHCKSEKHDDDVSSSAGGGGSGSGGKCQMHSNNVVVGSPGGGGILVKTEFNEMQQSKSSPVHEVFEMTSNAFTSTVLGGSSGSAQFHHDHPDSGSSPPLPLMESANASSHHHHHQLQHQHHQHHQCSPHSYESYLYASASGANRVGMSPRQPPGTMSAGAPSGGSGGVGSGGNSEVSGTLFHCKSFFADSGSGSSGIAAFYPNNQPHQSNNGDSCRGDDSTGGYPSSSTNTRDRDSEEKVVKAIKARKMSD